jgi:hypothetical protein
MKGWTFISPEGVRWFVAEARSANEAMDAIHMATVMGTLGTRNAELQPGNKPGMVITAHVYRVDEAGNKVQPK